MSSYLVKATVKKIAGFLGVLLLAAYPLTGVPHANALPFEASSTSRESVKVTGLPTNTILYPQLEELVLDSESLSFQRASDGRMFLAFVTQDASIDDLGSDRCSTSGRRQVYWVDKFSGEPAVCLSVEETLAGDPGAEGNSSSFNPRIGGPADDEGRYIVFESVSTNLQNCLLTADCDGFRRQLFVHDRKVEETVLSQPKDCSGGGFGDNRLWKLTSDGSALLFTSDGENLLENLSPPCQGGIPGLANVYSRNGLDCRNPGFGECKTSVVYDSYGYHAGGTTVFLLNGESSNAHMPDSGSPLVFDTKATEPVKFLPDLLSFRDIFMWQSDKFTRLSNGSALVEDTVAGTIEPKNIAGPANGDSVNPKVDDSGKLVVFESVATNLVLESDGAGGFRYKDTKGKRQIYLYNASTKVVSMVSVNAAGAAGSGDSYDPWISKDGRYVIFESYSTDLVDGITTTPVKNIFQRDTELNRTYIVTPGYNPAVGTRTDVQGLDADAEISLVSLDGLRVAFDTKASNVVKDDTIEYTRSVRPLPKDLPRFDSAKAARVAALGASATATQVAGALVLLAGELTSADRDVFIASNGCPTDGDGDGTPDCLDLCPNDPNKQVVGQCGCGVADTDSDSDGTANCNDQCSNDPNKTTAGSCGCGVAETDTDGDGTPDCTDGCPFNPEKLAPGVCGCGVPETDSNGNGVPDCSDPTLTGDLPAPFLTNLGVNNTVRATAGNDPYTGATYVFTFKYKVKGKNKQKKVTARTNQATARLQKGITVKVSYIIKLGTTQTAPSKTARIKVR